MLNQCHSVSRILTAAVHQQTALAAKSAELVNDQGDRASVQSHRVCCRHLATSSGSTTDHIMVPAKPPQPIADAESFMTSQVLGLELSSVALPGNVLGRVCRCHVSSRN